MPSWPQISFNETLSFSFLEDEPLQDFCNRVLNTLFQLQGRSLRLSLRFCNDEEIREVHDHYFQDPTSTDVISFPFEVQGNLESQHHAQGELLVCLPFAERQAKAHGNPVKNEVALYLIHGCLHILGFDDQNDQALEEMVLNEKACLKKLNLCVRGR
jgi:probable rRNA maturation factor